MQKCKPSAQHQDHPGKEPCSTERRSCAEVAERSNLLAHPQMVEALYETLRNQDRGISPLLLSRDWLTHRHHTSDLYLKKPHFALSRHVVEGPLRKYLGVRNRDLERQSPFNHSLRCEPQRSQDLTPRLKLSRSSANLLKSRT